MATMSIGDASDSQVSVLHRISNIVSSDLSLDEMLGEVVGLTVQATACDACLVYLIDPDTHDIVLKASQVPHAAALDNLRMKPGEGITGWVAEHKSVVALSSNAQSDTRFKRLQALVEDTYEAFLSVPLVSGGEVIGVINVHHRQPHEHSREEIGIVVFIGEQLGVTISRSMLQAENARLLEETQEMKRELETRKLVERAKGILQQRHGITEEDAYLRLRNQSRRLRKPMRELAEAIILAEDMNK
jgi:uroporphyrinogen-III synthase